MMEEIRASLPKRPEPTAFAPSASASPPVERKPQEARRADMSGLNLPFDIISDSALQIKGKNIRTQPEPIGEAVKELDRKVTIIGDIFDAADVKTTKTVRKFMFLSY